eukprot:9482895-Pyramimonas_sp.AAC.1
MKQFEMQLNSEMWLQRAILAHGKAKDGVLCRNDLRVSMKQKLKERGIKRPSGPLKEAMEALQAAGVLVNVEAAAAVAPNKRGGWPVVKMKKRPWSEVESSAVDVIRALRLNQDQFAE